MKDDIKHLPLPLVGRMPVRVITEDEAGLKVEDEAELKDFCDEPELCLHLADAFAQLDQAEKGNQTAIAHILQDVRAMKYVFVQRIMEG